MTTCTEPGRSPGHARARRDDWRWSTTSPATEGCWTY